LAVLNAERRKDMAKTLNNELEAEASRKLT
jgi:hypothetical protein